MTAASYTATASQFASAAMHLERRSEWQFYRRDGIRYVAVPSGHTMSNHTYAVRADAQSCECLWNEKTWTICSHMLAVELDALEQEMEEEYVVGSASLKAMQSLYPGCAAGCGNLADGQDGLWCDQCAAIRERSQRLAAARARVLEEWMA